MKKWLAIGLALLVLSGLVMGVSITLDFFTLDMQMTHEQRISTVHALNVMDYTALSFQLIGAWVIWKGFARSRSRLLKYASVVAACDIGSFLIALELSNAHWVWAWKVFRSLAW
jgi:hypothetical protein